MNDEDFLNISADSFAPFSETEVEGGSTPVSPLNPLQDKGVVMRVLHTRTEITIYPNGQAYQKSQSWFEDKEYIPKKKELKKPVKAQETQLTEEESY